MKKSDIKLLKRSMSVVKKLAPGYTTVMLLQAAIKAFIPYIPLYYSDLILTELAGDRNFRKLITYISLTIGITLFSEIINAVLNYISRVKNYRFVAEYERMINNKTYSISYEKVESIEINNLRSLIDANIATSNGGILALPGLFTNTIKCVFSIIIAIVMLNRLITKQDILLQNWYVYLIVTGLIISVVIGIFLIAVSQKKALEENYVLTKQLAKTNLLFSFYICEYLEESKASKDIRLFCQKPLISKILYNDILIPSVKNLTNQSKASERADLINVCSFGVIGGFVYVFVGLKALWGKLSIGKITKYYGSITFLIQAIISLFTNYYEFAYNNRYIELLFKYLDLPDDLETGIEKLSEQDLKDFEIEFRNVSFKYAGNENYALKNVSFKIRKGEHIAIVGKNGSGKTTMIKLLCRLYRPTSGVIMFNNRNINEYESAEYNKLLSVVFQDFKLFAFAVDENIAVSKTINLPKVWSSLNLAGIKKRVEKLPEGLKTVVYKELDENGIDLSGGEEQKMAIARAFYKESPILILDEPTSALDPFSEEMIFNKFEEMTTNKTAVFISHRLSSCKFCDRIIVFDKGKFVQTGSHNDLLSNHGGIYKRLWEAQAQYYQV